MSRPSKYPPELRERAVRTVFVSGRPATQIARDLSIHPETLRSWVRQAEADGGGGGGGGGERKDLLTTDERQQLK